MRCPLLVYFGRLHFDAARPVPWRDTVAVGALTLALYVALGQRTLHGLDVHDFIDWLLVGKSTHHIHYLYMPVVSALHALLAPRGVLPHATLLLASQLGATLGVVALHRAGGRLGLSRGVAAGLALAAATAPGVLFFATVGEIHAVFFGAFGVAVWAWADLLARPRRAGAVLLGIATALSAAVHATGHLLVGLLPLLAWGLGGRTALGWRLLVWFVAAHAVATLVLDVSLRPHDVDVTDAGMVGFVIKSLGQLPLGPRLWPVFRDEWLWPLLPGSGLVFLALAAAAVRRLAFALLLAWSGYYALTVVLLLNQVEHGAYLLPFAWPLALLTLAWLPRWLAPVALAGALVVGLARVHEHDAHPFENPPLLRGVAELARGGRVFVLCGGNDEWHPLLRDQAQVHTTPVFWLGQMLHLGYEAFAARFDALVNAQLDGGYDLIVTSAAHHLIASVPEPTLARFAREHLPVRYRLEPIASSVPGFVAYRLTRRR
jgi:hypothetical protein